MTADAVVARDAIRDLVARYNAYGDRGRFDELLALFVSDATMELRRGRGEEGVRRYVGVDAIRTIFTGVRTDMSELQSPGGPRFLHHHTSTHVIDIVDADVATGSLYFQVLTAVGLDHWGRYRDRYVRQDGAWRFAERVVHVDGYAAASPFRRTR